MNDKLLSVQEAAAILKVSIKTLHRWEEKGLLVPDRTTGNHRRYNLKDIENFKRKPQSADTSETEDTVASSTPTAVSQNPQTITLSGISSSKPNNNLSSQAATVKSVMPSLENKSNDGSGTYYSAIHELESKIKQLFIRPRFNKTGFIFLGLAVLMLATGALAGAGLIPGIAGIQSKPKNPEAQTELTDTGTIVDGSKLQSLNGEITFDVPAIFNQKVTVNSNTLISGNATVSGTLTAPNIVYSIIGGQNISITGNPQRPTISTGPIVSSFGGQTGDLQLAAGSGIAVNGLSINNTGVLALSAGSGISLSGSTGSVTISSDFTGVTSITGTANQVNVSASTGSVTLSLPQDIHTGATPEFAGLILNGDTITDFAGNGLEVSSNALVVSLLSAADSTGALSSRSGLEFAGAGGNQLSLLQGCNNGELLKWNDGTGNWECGTDTGGLSSAVVDIREGGVPVGTNVTVINFAASDFAINESPSGTDNIAIDYVNSQITRKNVAESISSLWTFGAGATITTGQTFTLNGEGFTDLTGTGLTFSGGSLQTTLGTSVDLASLEVVNTLSVGNGGTGLTTYATGDLIYASAANTLSARSIGTPGQVLTVSGGVPTWTTVSGATCPTCIINNPTSSQTIAPTGAGTTGLSVAQTSTASPTGDIFNVTNSAGSTKYLQVDSSGNLTTRGSITNPGFTTNGGLLYTNASGLFSQTGAGTATTVLHGGATPSYSAVSLTADVSGILPIANGGTGANTLNDLIALSTHTTGNYVATLTSGNGISSTATGEGSTPTIALGALTADWNQTGAFDIMLNNAASELRIMESTGGTFYGSLDVGDLTADRTYVLPNLTAASDTICLVALGNCAGSGTGVTAPIAGTTNRIAKFTAGQTIGDSGINDLSSALAMTIDAGGNVLIGNTAQTSGDQKLLVYSNTNSIQRIDAQNINAGTLARSGFIARSDTAQLATDVYSSTNIQGIAEGLSPANLINIGAINSSALLINTNNASPIVLSTNLTERLRITSTGNVGIGTTNPTQFVEIIKSADAQLQTKLENSSNTANAYTEFLAKAAGVNTYLGSSPANYGSFGANRGYLLNNGGGGLDIGAFSAGNDIRFYTAGYSAANERMRIDSSGNVGIGTTAPLAILDIRQVSAYLQTFLGNDTTTGDTARSAFRFLQNGADAGRIESGREADYTILANQDSYLGFRTAINGGDVERLRITSAGNVGIGTTLPSSSLDVVGTTAKIRVQRTDDTPLIEVIRNGTPGNNSIGGYSFAAPDSGSTLTTFAHIEGIVTDNTNLSEDGAIAFRTQTAGSLSEAMRIVSGKVGIGTTAPSELFEIAGSSGVTAGLKRSSADVNSANIRFQKDRVGAIVQNGDELGWIDFSGYDGSTYRRGAYILSTVDGTPGASDLPGNLTFATTPDGSAAAIERLRITSSGNVGIGTTTPGARLDVSDSARIGNGGLFGYDVLAANTPLYVSKNWASDPGATVYGGLFEGNLSAGSGNVFGLNVAARANTTATNTTGIYGISEAYGTSSVGNLYGVRSQIGTRGSGGATNGYGLYIHNPFKVSTGLITNNYGLYIEDQTTGTNNYSIYSAGGQSYFAGNVGIGTNSPSAPLTIGSATAGSDLLAFLPQSAVTTASFTGTVTTADLTGNKTFILPNITAASDTICLVAQGNCAGSGSGVTTAGGTSGRLARFSGAQAIENAGINDASSAVAITIDSSGNVGIGETTPGYLLSVGSGNLFGVNSSGNIVWEGATADAFELTLSPADVGQDSTITIPNPLAATDTVCLLGLANCTGTGGGIAGTGTANRVAYFTAANTIASDNDFFFDGTNVGIGTTGPGKKLDITASAAQDGLRVRNTQANIPTFTLGITDVANVDWNLQNQAGDLRFQDGNALDTVTFKKGGNVGIGITNPGYKLAVQGNANDLLAGSISAANLSDGTTAGSIVGVNSGTSNTASGFLGAFSGSYTSDANLTDRLVLKTNGDASGLSLYTGGASQDIRFLTNSTERLRIDASGNVGIDAIPQAWDADYTALQVGKYASLVSTTTGGASNWSSLDHNSYFDGAYKYLTSAPATEIAYGNGAGRIDFNVATSGTANNPISWTTAMTIANSGNVGIGATAPGNKLSVNALTTADNLGQLAIGTNATTNKGLIIQGVAGQTASLFEVQNNSGTPYFKINPENATNTTNIVVNPTWTSTAGNQWGEFINPTISPTANSSTNFIPFKIYASYNSSFNLTGPSNNLIQAQGFQFGTGNMTNLTGVAVDVGNLNTGTLTTMTGIDSRIGNGQAGFSAGTVTTAYAGRFRLTDNLAGGTIGTNYGIKIETPNSAGTINSNYGLYIDNQTGGSTNYSLYSNGGQSYFAGNIGIGTAPAASPLTIGTVTAGSDLLAFLPQSAVTTASFTGTITTADLTGNKTFILPNITAASDTICLVAQGNCAGSGTGVTTAGGTANRLARFNGSQSLDNGSINDLGTAVAMTIDASGNVGIGTTNPSSLFHVSKTGGSAIGTIDSDFDTQMFLNEYVDNNDGPDYLLRKARGTIASPTIVQSGDQMGRLRAYGYDGGAFREGARVEAIVDGTPGSGDMPGRLSFWTTPDGTTTLTERMRIDNAGNVGIGTTNPSSQLDVVGTAAKIRVQRTDDTPLIEIIRNGTPGNNSIGGYSFAAPDSGSTLTTFAHIEGIVTDNTNLSEDGAIAFRTQTAGSLSEAMRIVSGNVGIGTTAPEQNLDVRGVSQFRRDYAGPRPGVIVIANRDTTAGVLHGAGLGWNFARTGDSTAREAANILVGKEQEWTSTASTNDVFLAMEVALDGTPIERLRITSAGNVGIGTTNPTSKLHVVGPTSTSPLATFESDGVSTADANVFINGNNVNQNAVLTIQATTAGANPLITFKDIGTSNYSSIGLERTASPYLGGTRNDLIVANNTNGRDILFGTKNTTLSEKMRITSGGNVGIGTTNPGDKLHIAGANVALKVEGTTGNSDIRIIKATATDYGTLEFRTGATRTHFISHYNDGTFRITRDTGSLNDLVLNAGNVGIGTTAPSSLFSVGTGSLFQVNASGNVLYVNGTTDTSTYACRNSLGQLAACNTTGTGAAFVQGGNTFGALATLGTNDNNGLSVRTNGTERFQVTAGGILQVGPTSTYGASSKVTINANGSGVGGLTIIGDSFPESSISFYNSTGTGNAGLGGIYGVAADSSLRVTSSYEFASVILQENGGRVGINTTSPTAELEVKGFSQVPGVAMTATSGSTTFTTNSAVAIYAGDYIIPATSTGQARTVTVGGSGTSFTVSPAFSANVTAESFTLHRPISNFTKNTGSSALFVQGGTGNVGIGITNPSTKLDIQGVNSIATLGSELNTNTNFSTQWNNTGWTTSSTTATHNTGNTTALSPTTPISVSAGATYQIVFTIATSTNGSDTVTPSIGGVSGSGVTLDGVQTQLITTTTTGNLFFTPTTNFNGTISAVSVKQVTSSYALATIRNSDATAGLEFRSGGSGLKNTIIGVLSGQSITTGFENTTLGYNALQYDTTGKQNTAIGSIALQANTTGNNNTALGYATLNANTTGGANTALGWGVLPANTTGVYNTGSGQTSLQANTTGNYNAAYGANTLYNSTTGSNNAVLGAYAIWANTTGGNNAALGYGALYSNTTGGNNVAIGYFAGYTSVAGNANLTGSNNIFIGYNAGPASATQLSNATAIGTYAVVGASNSIVLGCIAGVNGCTTSPNIGIGITNPTAALHIDNISSTYDKLSLNIGDADGTPTTGVAKITRTNNISGGGSTSNALLTLNDQSSNYPLYVTNETGANILSLKGVGNFGLGTASPIANFEVNQATTGPGRVSTTAAGSTVTGSNTQFTNTFKVGDTITVSGESAKTITAIASDTSLTVSGTFTNTNSSVTYTLAGGSRLVVQGNGNVGIGVTNPTAQLDIKGINDVAGQISLQVRSGNSGTNFNSNQITLAYGGNDLYRHAIKSRHFSTQQAGNAIDFFVWNQGTDLSTAIGTKHVMTLDGTGNVGIGTTAPNSVLQLHSTAVTTDRRLMLTDATSGSTVTDGLALIKATTQDGYLWNYENSALRLGTNNLERLTILNDGNVGIGTTAPTAKLDLQGSVTGPNYGFGLTNQLSITAPTEHSYGIYNFPTLINSATGKEAVSLAVGATINAGAGITVNNGYGINVSALTKTGSGTVTNAYGLFVNTPTAGTNNYAAVFNGGNVGIGVTNPGSLLTLQKTSGNTVDINLNQSGVASWTIQNLATTANFNISNSGLGSVMTILNSNGNVGIGDATPDSLFTVGNGDKFRVDTNGHVRFGGSADAFGTNYMSFSNVTALNSASTVSGINGEPGNSGSGSIYGVNIAANSSFAGTVNFIAGLRGVARTMNAATVATNAYALQAGSPVLTAGAITNATGLLIEAQDIAGVGTGYGIYQTGSADLNYFAGNVGIGLTNPSTNLEITGANNSNSGIWVNDVAGHRVSISGSNGVNGLPYVGTLSNHVLTLGTNGTEKVRIDTSGNVGIGTTAPSALLHVAGTGLFKNSTNSTTAFQVQNATGNSAFMVDTTNSNATLGLTNPSFETDTTSWTARTGCTLTRDTTTRVFGLASGKCVNTATANAGLNFPITLTNSTAYTLSFYAKAAADPGSVLTFGYSYNGSDETTYVSAGQYLGTSWYRYSIPFTPTGITGTPYIFIKQADGTARTVYIDGVQIEAAAAANPYADGFAQLPVLNTSLRIAPTDGTGEALNISPANGSMTPLLLVNSTSYAVGIGSAGQLNNLLQVGSAATADYTGRLFVGGPGGTNKNLILQAAAGQTGNLFEAQNSSATPLVTIDVAGRLTMASTAATSGSPTLLTVTAPAHTTLTASTEAPDINLNLARTVQFATGALTTQRAFQISAPTYGFVGASTITNAATFYIAGAPTAGTNATITNPYAMWVDAGVARFDGRVIVDATVGSSTNGLCWSNATATAQIEDCNGTPGDYAEYYGTSDTSIDAGDLVIIDVTRPAQAVEENGRKGSKAYIVKSNKSYQGSLLGIVSTDPNQTIGENFTPDENPRPVALSGRVPVQVASDSPAISAGDYITSSDEAGKAMKATRAGQMIGKALEDWTPGSGTDKIMVFVTTAYADPNDLLANLSLDSSGNLVLPATDEEIVTALGGESTVSSQQSAVKRDLGWTLGDIIKRITRLEDKLASGSGSLSSSTDSAKLDVLTGRVDSNTSEIDILKSSILNLKSRTASLEADLALFASGSAVLSPTPSASSAAELSIDKLDTRDAIISNTLSVGGRTTLSDVGITGRMNIGLLSVEGLSENGYATINTTSGKLQLQSDGVNGIDILNGKITIEPNGNMKVNGTVTVKKLNVDTADVAGASLGEATIEAGTSSIVIETSSVTAKSKIFVTPKSKTSLPLSVTTQTAGDSFKVEISAPATSDIKFSWFIVN